MISDDGSTLADGSPTFCWVGNTGLSGSVASSTYTVQYMVMPEAQAAATIMVSGWLTGAKLREMVIKKGT